MFRFESFTVKTITRIGLPMNGVISVVAFHENLISLSACSHTLPFVVVVP